MNNEEGLALKVGDQVWTIDAFECLYMPYRIVSAPYKQETQFGAGAPRTFNVFVHIVAEHLYNGPSNGGERMNVHFLSHTHPRGWKFSKE